MRKMFYLLIIKSQSDQPLQMIFFHDQVMRELNRYMYFKDTFSFYYCVMVTSFIIAHTAYRSFYVRFLALEKTFIHCFVTDVQPLYEHEYSRH